MAMNERSSTPCPRCRRDNPPEDHFCGACGASLTVGGPLAHRPEGSPSPASRAPLSVELKPVVKAVAVGLAVLAGRAGLMWLRRRAEGSGWPSLPTIRGTEPA